jgi:hypothetical protein
MRHETQDLRVVFGLEVRAQIIIEAAEPIFGAVDERHLGPVARKDGSELHRDVTAAHDEDALREVLEIECFVGCNSKLLARDVRHEWPPT